MLSCRGSSRYWLSVNKPIPAYKGNEPYIFASYSHSDGENVYPEIQWLASHGIPVWYDEGIEAGTRWRDEIARSIKNARLFIFFVTPASVQSENCLKEVNYAIDHKIPLLAVHLSKTELPDGLKLAISDLQAILCYETTSPEYRQRLISRIENFVPPSEESREPPASVAPEKQDRKPVSLIPIVVAAVIAIAAGAYRFTSGTAPQAEQVEASDIPREQLQAAFRERGTVGVETFRILQPDNTMAAFAESLKEELMSRFIRTTSIKVSAVNDLPDANIYYRLSGSLLNQGEKVRISAQLTRVRDNVQIWSDTYEVATEDLYQDQARIAKQIAYFSGPRLTRDVVMTLNDYIPGIRELSAATHAAFGDWNKEYTRIRLGEGGSWTLVEQHLHRIIEHAPELSFGHAMLANMYHQAHLRGDLAYDDARPRAMAALERARAAAIESPFPGTSALTQLGLFEVLNNWDYARGSAVLREEVKKNPNAIAYASLSEIARREGRLYEAASLMESVTQMVEWAERSYFLTVHSNILSLMGEPEQALVPVQEALDLTVSGADRALALASAHRIYTQLARAGEAQEMAEQLWQLDGGKHRSRFMYVFIDGAHHDEALSLLNSERVNNDLYFGTRALAHAMLGDNDRAFDLIARGIHNHDFFLANTFRMGDMWEPLRNDPRFDEMLTLLSAEETHTAQYIDSIK